MGRAGNKWGRGKEKETRGRERGQWETSGESWEPLRILLPFPVENLQASTPHQLVEAEHVTEGVSPCSSAGKTPPHMFSGKLSSISPLRALLSRLSPANQSSHQLTAKPPHFPRIPTLVSSQGTAPTTSSDMGL